jgi:hypothetical protein
LCRASRSSPAPEAEGDERYCRREPEGAGGERVEELGLERPTRRTSHHAGEQERAEDGL